jgi:hypothetical protein
MNLTNVFSTLLGVLEIRLLWRLVESPKCLT